MGFRCDICGKGHGITPSVVNKWHQRRQCGTIYCDDCGRVLRKPSILSGERICPRYGGRTRLF